MVDAAARLPAEGMRAIVANSGNANALAGPDSVSDARAVCAAVAEALGVAPDSVLGASTGVIGVRLPVAKLAAAAPRLAAARGVAIESAAEAVWTTDTRVKLASRTMRVGDCEATFAAFAKGAGMIAPELATVLAFITTDLRVSARTLQSALSLAVQTSFEMLTVDGDMSTNDTVFALANGLAANTPVAEGTPEYDALVEHARGAVRRPGATGRRGRRRGDEARRGAHLGGAGGRHGARAGAGGGRFHARQGRDLRRRPELGAGAGGDRRPRRVAKVADRPDARDRARAGDVRVPRRRAPTGADALTLRAKMRDPVVLIEVRLAEGDARATAWGCDLSYDFVKINADYTSLTHAAPDGTIARDDRLTNYSPGFKRALLVEALSYIARFTNTRASSSTAARRW